ncbi:MAG: threonine synthase, partial [Clostridia bacterium]
GTPPVKLTRLDNDYVLELWHGPTAAFKDMALQIMPRLLSMSLEKTNEKRTALILVATSGDTGKAALEGYADVDNVKILVFYPALGVSDIQKRQMQTQAGKNVRVVAINGNFDDAQNGVKSIFGDSELARVLNEKNVFLSSANSINFGRLAPQIVYYVSAYCSLMKNKEISYGEKINVTVPTGNFGNILAAYIAKKSGVPLGKLICASNKNNILTDFFNTGIYDKNRDFYTTVSPSMDILISSNLERLLYIVAGPEKTIKYMNLLKQTGRFEVDDTVKNVLNQDFLAYYCDDDNTRATIKNTFVQYNYLCDTHTAVGIYAAAEYKKQISDNTKMLVASTASPYKFAPAACDALDLHYDGDEFSAIETLFTATGAAVPKNLAELKGKPIIFDKTIEILKMSDEVKDFA